MISANKTVEIYYLVDEFLKEYDSVIKSHSLEEGAPKKRRNRKFTMSNSEIIRGDALKCIVISCCGFIRASFFWIRGIEDFIFVFSRSIMSKLIF